MISSKALLLVAIATAMLLIVVQANQTSLGKEELEYNYLLACLNEHRYKVACEELKKAVVEVNQNELENSTQFMCDIYDKKRAGRENLVKEHSLGECDAEVPHYAESYGIEMAQEEIERIKMFEEA